MSPGAHIAIFAIAIVTTLVALAGANRRTRLSALIALAILAAVVFALQVWPKPFPDAVPWVIYAAGAAAIFVVVSALLQHGRRAMLAPVAVVAVANAYLVSNLTYQEYPAVGSFYPVPVAASVTLDQFRALKKPPTDHGREVGALVTIPAGPMRDAVAYVPPAYWSTPNLPVMVMMAGSPGSPMDWFTKGEAADSLDAFQASHNGASPVMISVDATGSETGNPACADGPDLQVLSYVTDEIPTLVRENFRVSDDPAAWTVGGLSYGGTCAMQAITNRPDVYRTFLDFSGEAEPNVGSREKTVQQFYGGDEDAFTQVNAADMLARAHGGQTYAGIAGRFVSGADDHMSTAALPHLNDLAQAADIDSTYDTVPGSHSYHVWRVALRDSLDFVAARGGIQ